MPPAADEIIGRFVALQGAGAGAEPIQPAMLGVARTFAPRPSVWPEARRRSAIGRSDAFFREDPLALVENTQSDRR